MSKQKIRDWLYKNEKGLFISKDNVDFMADIIDKYTKDQSAWVSVDIEPSAGQEVLIRIPVSSGRVNIESATYKGNGVFIGCWCDLRGKGQSYAVSGWQSLPPTQEA